MSEPLTIQILGLTLPVKRWTISVFSVLACLAIIGLISRQVFPELPQLISLSEANERLRTEMNEYGRHFMETPKLETRTDGDELVLKVYEDGCVAIQRRQDGKVTTRLVPEPATTAPPKKMTFAFMPVVEAQGRCLNPHPGPFGQVYGQRNGCWLEVWRTFQDGCIHVQLFNTCSNSWATNPDGSPQVRWTACRH